MATARRKTKDGSPRRGRTPIGEEAMHLDSYSVEPRILTALNAKSKSLGVSKSELIRLGIMLVLESSDEDIRRFRARRIPKPKKRSKKSE